MELMVGPEDLNGEKRFLWAGDPAMFPPLFGERDTPLPGVSGEFDGGWGVKGGTDPGPTPAPTS